MRLKPMWAALAAIIASGVVVAAPAQAGGLAYRHHHYDYYPAYHPVSYKRVHRHVRPAVVGYAITDPYAYRYEPRGYYPYYDAHYWRPLCPRRLNCVPRQFQSPYWQAWGYPTARAHHTYEYRVRPWHW